MKIQRLKKIKILETKKTYILNSGTKTVIKC